MAQFAYPLDGEQNYTSAQAGAFNGTRTSGVWSTDDNLKVTVSNDRKLTVYPGLAWFTTDVYWGKVYCNTENVIINLPIADGMLDRICRVIVRWSKIDNTATIQMLTGELSSSPVAPVVTQTDDIYDLALADYKIVHGEINGNPANLTDKRLDETVCGIMQDAVTKIPTETLQAQAEALINQLEAAIASALSGGIPAHASTHATGGSDPITPENIGAQAARLTFTDLAVPVSAWMDDAYDQYADFPYQAQVACAGVTADMFADVVLNPEDAVSGNYAPICVTGAGIVWLYAKAIPSAAITIRSIVAWR